MGRVRVGAMAMVLVGCGGGSASPEFDITPGHSVVTPAIQSVTLTSKGGGLGGGPCHPGGACLGAIFSYTLSLDTKRLAFNGYQFQSSDPTMAVLVMDDVALSASQLDTVTAAARAVTVSARRECGADAPDRELRVESQTKIVVYGDDFFGCQPRYDYFVTYEGLDNLQTVFATITPAP